MAINVTKPAINLREKLNEVTLETGIKGEELLNSDTSTEARNVLELDTHLFTDFESTGIDDNATSTAITIDASENVGIGTATPSAKVDIRDIGGRTIQLGKNPTTNYYGSSLYMSVDIGSTEKAFNIGTKYSATGGNLVFEHSTNEMGRSGDASALTYTERMRIDSSGNVNVKTGNLVIGTSGKGIDFSADANNANMTSEVLDDYEEGTWTPEYGCSTTDPSGVTYDNVVFGTYVKIGKQVFISGGIRHDGMSSAGSGSLQIKGFPFSAESSSGGGTPRYALSVSQAESWSDLHPVSMFMGYGGDTADILTAASSTNPQKGRTNLYHTDLQTSGTNQDLITFFGHYQVA